MRALFIPMLLSVLNLASCKKKESGLSDQKKVRTVLSAQAFAGRERIKLTWKLPDVDNLRACVVSWNGGNDSLSVPVAPGEDTVSQIINNLPEGAYSFKIRVYDKHHTASQEVMVRGNVYGDQYQGSLHDRPVYAIQLPLFEEDKAVIDWGDAASGCVGTEIKYTDTLGAVDTAFTPQYVSKTTLADYKRDYEQGDAPQYRTLYLPGIKAIDTFYTAYRVLPSAKPNDQDMVLESLDGRVTQNELNAFKTFIKTYDPDPGKNYDNEWVFGRPSRAVEACGLMYEATGDVDVLNRMIFYCDRILASRDDLAPAAEGGQLVTWTGHVEPVWPSHKEEPAQAGVEQGRVLAHMAFCAKLILQNSAIWNDAVPTGDPHHFGATYKERALKYISEADYVIDNWIMPRFIRQSDRNRYYFPGPPNTYMSGGPAPWNQAFMLTDALVRLTECHLLLNDDPGRVAAYDAIVKPNLEWFFSSLKKSTAPDGKPVYLWNYVVTTNHVEDFSHFAFEAEGLGIAYNTGRYGITFDEMVPVANTLIDVIIATKTGDNFAGRVDGTTGTGNSGGKDYVHWEYFYLLQFRPDQFKNISKIDYEKYKTNHLFENIVAILWEKQRRYRNGIH